jgi:hypothetical protein
VQLSIDERETEEALAQFVDDHRADRERVVLRPSVRVGPNGFKINLLF